MPFLPNSFIFFLYQSSESSSLSKIVFWKQAMFCLVFCSENKETASFRTHSFLYEISPVSLGGVWVLERQFALVIGPVIPSPEVAFFL